MKKENKKDVIVRKIYGIEENHHIDEQLFFKLLDAKDYAKTKNNNTKIVECVFELTRSGIKITKNKYLN